MVKCATKGHSVKAVADNFGCGGGSKALGLIPSSEQFYSGEEFYSFKIFNDLKAAKKTSEHISICQTKAYGIEVGPLSSFQGAVDVVILVTNPYNVMHIVHGYN